MKKLTEITFAFLLSVVIVSIFFNKQKKFEEFALGEETTSHFAKLDNIPIHIDYLTKVDSLKQGWEKRGKKDIVFCLGNSQTHAINQKQTNETTYVGVLADTMLKHAKDVMSSSAPNASLQEMMLTLDWVLQELPIKYLTLPVFMDDLREDGIRTAVLFDNQSISYQMKDTSFPIVKKVNKELAATHHTNNDIAALHQTPQETVENYLNNLLEVHVPIWGNRKELRGDFFTGLYNTRNTLLGINAQTKRKMIPQRYQNNMEALDYILKTCNKQGIKVLLYIPPIRDDVEVPYELNAYEKFKTELSHIAKQYSNVQFCNLEKIVPGKYWGMKAATNIGGRSELDFMHFQYAGHQLLASHLYFHLKNML